MSSINFINPFTSLLSTSKQSSQDTHVSLSRKDFSVGVDTVMFSGKKKSEKTSLKTKSKAAAYNGPEYQWRSAAVVAWANLQHILENPRPLTQDDLRWLDKLNDTLGAPLTTIPHPDVPNKVARLNGKMTLDRINEDPVKHLTALKNTLDAMLAASHYNPTVKRLDGYTLKVHNPKVADWMKEAYTSKTFDQLMALCEANGTFDVTIDEKTGLVKTTDISDEEDEIMVQAWFTDTARNLVLQKDRAPETVPKVLVTTARAYMAQIEEMESIIRNPDTYYNDERNVGVTHIFNPQTLKPYDWLNPKRLESHGLMLGAYCDAIVDGLIHGDKAGFTEKVPQIVLTAMGNVAQYLDRLEYWKAPTIGPWEELVYENGLTGDINIIRQAFSKVYDLMFNPAYDNNPAMTDVRKKLRSGSGFGLLNKPEKLETLIQKGEKKVRKRLLGTPEEHPSRPADAALAFVGGSDLKLSDNLINDVKAHINVLEFLEETIVGENGLLRYPPFPVEYDGKTVNTTDGYLMPNWGLMADKTGRISLFKEEFEKRFGYPIAHLEASDEQRFHTRAKLGIEGKEAEWFMIPEMSTSYGNQLKKLLDAIEAEDRKPTKKEKELIEYCLKKQTEYVNRGYARITPERATKANGRECPAWKVPEAYQHVTVFKAEDQDNPDVKNRKTVMMPGVNTPLAWAASSLYGASKLMKENLERLETLAL